MKYAVIESGGKQYKVQKGDIIEVEKTIGEKGSVSFDKVLMTVDDGKVTLGKPFIKNAMVRGKIKEQKRGDKIDVLRYRSKSRYRKRIGHRKDITEIEIGDISTSSTRENKSKS